MKNREEREQVAAIAVLARLAEHHRDPSFGLVHHSPNGGARSVVTGARMKAMGTRRGFPDLILAVPSPHGRLGLVIEVKAGKGKETPEQTAWLMAFHRWGWTVRVCRSAGAVVREVLAHLGYGVEPQFENWILMAGGSWDVEPTKPTTRGKR